MLVAIRSQHKHNPEEVLEAFRIFDPEGTGAIRVDVFRGAMEHLAGFTAAELDDLIAEAREISRAEAARRRELSAARDLRRAARRAGRGLDDRAERVLSPTAPAPAYDGVGGGGIVVSPVAEGGGGAGGAAGGGAGHVAVAVRDTAAAVGAGRQKR